MVGKSMTKGIERAEKRATVAAAIRKIDAFGAAAATALFVDAKVRHARRRRGAREGPTHPAATDADA